MNHHVHEVRSSGFTTAVVAMLAGVASASSLAAAKDQPSAIPDGYWSGTLVAPGRSPAPWRWCGALAGGELDEEGRACWLRETATRREPRPGDG